MELHVHIDSIIFYYEDYYDEYDRCVYDDLEVKICMLLFFYISYILITDQDLTSINDISDMQYFF